MLLQSRIRDMLVRVGLSRFTICDDRASVLLRLAILHDPEEVSEQDYDGHFSDSRNVYGGSLFDIGPEILKVSAGNLSDK